VQYGAGIGEDIYTVWSIYGPGEVYGASNGWREMTLDFSNLDGSGFPETNLLNRNNVYIYFGAVSYDYAYFTPEYLEGIFIDDLLIKKCTGGTCPIDW
jgi:hypothetical protein